MPPDNFHSWGAPLPTQKRAMYIGQQAWAVKYRSEVMESIKYWLNLSFVRFSDHDKAQNLAVAGWSKWPEPSRAW